VIPTRYVNATGISAQQSSEEFTRKSLALENKANSVCRSTHSCFLYLLPVPAAFPGCLELRSLLFFFNHLSQCCQHFL
jgi:hypothetical protein